MTLGSSQPNKLWHYLIISILDVLKSFIKNLFNVKSSEFNDLLSKLHTSRQYKRTGVNISASFLLEFTDTFTRERHRLDGSRFVVEISRNPGSIVLDWGPYLQL